MQFRGQFILTIAVLFGNATFSTHLAFIVITDDMRLIGFGAVIGVAYAGGSLVDRITAELRVSCVLMVWNHTALSRPLFSA